MGEEGLEHSGKHDVWVAGFDAKVCVQCPKCMKPQYRNVWISMEHLEFQKRLFNFKCETVDCNFKSTFLFYLGLNIT